MVALSGFPMWSQVLVSSSTGLHAYPIGISGGSESGWYIMAGIPEYPGQLRTVKNLPTPAADGIVPERWRPLLFLHLSAPLACFADALDRSTEVRVYFRADAAFAKPDNHEYLEEQRVFYAIRLPSKRVLQCVIAPLLIRPVGRPPKRPVILYYDFWYRAESWDRARRVVAKVEWHQGELFPRVGFIFTNMTGPEHDCWPRRSGAILQWSWDSRAVDQGREVHAELDSAVVPSFRGQPSAFVPVRPGLQPRKLPSPAVSAQGVQALVAAERAGQADQDGRPSGAALPAVDLPVIRGVGSSTVFRGSVGSFRPVITGTKLRKGITKIVPRGRALRESACLRWAFTPLAEARRRQRWTKSMVHGKKRTPCWIDRRSTGVAGTEYHAIISFRSPIEPKDSQYGESRSCCSGGV